MEVNPAPKKKLMHFHVILSENPVRNWCHKPKHQMLWVTQEVFIQGERWQLGKQDRGKVTVGVEKRQSRGREEGKASCHSNRGISEAERRAQKQAGTAKNLQRKKGASYSEYGVTGIGRCGSKWGQGYGAARDWWLGLGQGGRNGHERMHTCIQSLYSARISFPFLMIEMATSMQDVQQIGNWPLRGCFCSVECWFCCWIMESEPWCT